MSVGISGGKGSGEAQGLEKMDEKRRGRADESTSDMIQSAKTLVFGAKDHQNTYLYPNEILLYVSNHVQTSGCSKDCVSTSLSVTQFPACFVLTKHDLCLILTKWF